MPSWRKPRRSSSAPPTSDGATSLQAQSRRDLYGNACIGPDIKLFETHNCIIHTVQERRVVVQGLDGFIVAENNDTLLICKLSEEQRIKQFSEEN